MVDFKNMVYLPDQDAYAPDNEVPAGTRTLSISGTELRDRLQDGREIPEWFTFPQVAAELRKTHPPRSKQGFTVFFTGLSGSAPPGPRRLPPPGRASDHQNGGIAICAPIAPYAAVRQQVRDLITPLGGYTLVHVATPIEVCEQRDRKGLYAKARAGIVKGFTGISDPYETPEDAEIVLDTSDVSPEQAAQRIILHLESEGFIDATRD